MTQRNPTQPNFITLKVAEAREQVDSEGYWRTVAEDVTTRVLLITLLINLYGCRYCVYTLG